MAALPEGDMQRVLDAARAGDAAALHELVRQARPRVFRWALVRTGDPDEAEDVAQEVSMTIVRRLDRFGGGSFWAWLYRVTSNRAVDERRRSARSGGLPLTLVDEEGAGVADFRARDVMGAMADAEVVASLRRFMGALSERQRAVLDLVDLQGHSAVEAASMLGIDPATARVHLLRARRALRARLIGEEPSHEL